MCSAAPNNRERKNLLSAAATTTKKACLYVLIATGSLFLLKILSNTNKLIIVLKNNFVQY